jgi:hypothetical protein
MLKKNSVFDKNLNTRHVYDVRRGARPGIVLLDRSPGLFSCARFTTYRIGGRHGVNPEPPEGTGAASVLPFKRGTRTTGAVSGEAAYGETGNAEEARGGPPIGWSPPAPQ